MNEHDNKPNSLENVRNVLQSDKIFGKRKRNIIEAIIFVLIDIIIIGNINFVSRVQWILICTTVPLLIRFNLKGIKNRSVTQIFIAEIKFRRNRRKLHLRSIDYVRKQNNYTRFNIEGESLAEKTTFIAKKILFSIIKK